MKTINLAHEFWQELISENFEWRALTNNSNKAQSIRVPQPFFSAPLYVEETLLRMHSQKDIGMVTRQNPSITDSTGDTNCVLHVGKPVSAKQLERAETISKEITKLKAELDRLIGGKNG